VTIQIFANNAKTTLASAITSTQTTITVAPGTGSQFPTPITGQQFKVTLVSAASASIYEVCNCTARSGDVLTVIRGQEGTTGQPFLLNDIVGHFDTAAVMSDLVQSEQLQAGTYVYTDVGGTANALTATIASNLTSIPDGLNLVLGAASANTGAASLVLTLGSTILASHSIVKGNNAALVAGDIPAAGYPIQINWSPEFNSYVMQNPATGIFVAAVPTGAIVQFPATTAPSGYLVAAGQLVSRTTYASLWTFAQASGNVVADGAWQAGNFSSGNGSTNFRLPQYGGYFLRGLDNGNGIDPGRAIGTVQANQNQSHAHTANVNDPTHAHGAVVYDPGHLHYSNGVPGIGQGAAGGNSVQQSAGSQPTSGAGTGISVGIYGAYTGISVGIANAGGSESRPVNISALTCIKY